MDGARDDQGDDAARQLREACAAGGLEAARALLAAGASVEAKDDRGKTALYFAAKRGDVRVMELLLDHDADLHAVTKKRKSVLYVAAFRGGVAAVQFLLERGHRVDVRDEFGRTVLFGAAQHNDVDTMRVLIDHGVDLHAVTTSNKSTVLHYAANCGAVEAVTFLLAKGLAVAGVDAEGMTAFHFAALMGHLGVMRVLVEHGADPSAPMPNGRTALHCAAAAGQLDVVTFVLDQGVSVDVVDTYGATAFHDAAYRGHVDVMRVLLEHGADASATMKDRASALRSAAQSGNPEAVSFLLEQGLSSGALDETGDSAFHYAAWYGDVSIMRRLLDCGADPHAVTSENETALHKATHGAHIGHDNVDAIQLLLDLGLAINEATEDGSTALHKACLGGDVGTVGLLLEYGANVHALTKKGESALHICAASGAVDAAKLLIDRGASVNGTESDGWTALHEATKLGSVEMMRLLIDRGADAHAETNTHKNIVHLAAMVAEISALKYALELGVDVNARVKTFKKTEQLVVLADEITAMRNALDLIVDVNARAKVIDDRLSPLLIAFHNPDCESASEMAHALCSAGARFDGEDRQIALTLSEPAVLTAGKGRDTNASSESALWRSGLCVCVDHWTQEHHAGTSNITKIPIEVIRRGEASVRTYLKDAAQSTNDDRLHRCKVCVVGPSEWGKTSLVQSLKTDGTFLSQLKDRTIGIDLTTCQLASIVDGLPVQLEITFWDFAGQDVYHAAHTLFFSQRTLFVLVVNLEAYWKELQDAESKPDQVSQAQMNRFAGAKIFRWVRSIFAHRPDAQFVVVGSKVDRLEDTSVVAEIWDDLLDRLDHWKAAFAKGFDADLLPAHASNKDIKALQAQLSQLASSEWRVANIMEVESIRSIRSTLQSTITSSELGFEMWKTYTNVLRSVVKRRDEARQAVSPQKRIEKSIIRFTNLRRQLLREIDGLEREACEQILRTLNDLGDVLWYEHDGAGVFKDCIILDPMLVIEVVREVIRHDFSSDTDRKAPTDGRIIHSLLGTFPLWKDMDVELLHAFKGLLQHFQLAYPADADVMLPESDIIVPAYWNADQLSISGSKAKPKLTAPQKSVCDTFAVHRWCWEYEVPSELSETIFVQFAVRSHSSYLARSIRGYRVEAACAEFATSISLIQKDSPRDVLRIEVSGVSAELSWHNMRFYLMKMEKVLEGYPGDLVWRSIVYRPARSTLESRHPVGPLMKAIEDAIAMGRGKDAAREKMPWMPPDMDWFMRKAWNDIASFQQLRMDQLVLEKLEVLQKLAIVGDKPRQFPALWSLEYIPEEQKALVRMSSDLSGRCYHVPLEIDTGSALLARHASVLRAGVSLFATVVGNAVSLPIVQNVLEAAKSAFDKNADHAERVHNLIDKLDLSSEQFDARTTSKLSPGPSMVLLRDLLKAYDDSLDALEISEISNLECAVTSSGEYVWAHAHEIASMGGKLTRCSTPPSAWKELALPAAASTATSPTSSSSTIVPSLSSDKVSSKTDFKFSVCVDSVAGLSDWDWHKTYCKWQLYYGRKSLTPLAMDITPTNDDSSCAPSWSTMRKTVESVASVEMLRECRLAVQVKRRSRIGWTKLIGEGEVWLRDFVDEDASQNFSCQPVKVPLGETSDRAVILHLALEK